MACVARPVTPPRRGGHCWPLLGAASSARGAISRASLERAGAAAPVDSKRATGGTQRTACGSPTHTNAWNPADSLSCQFQTQPTRQWRGS